MPRRKGSSVHARFTCSVRSNAADRRSDAIPERRACWEVAQNPQSTSHAGASSATAPHLPDADLAGNRAIGRTWNLPVSKQQRLHARFSDPLGRPGTHVVAPIWPSAISTASGPGTFISWLIGRPMRSPVDASSPASRCTAWVGCRSLLLHRSGLSPPACRLPAAMRRLRQVQIKIEPTASAYVLEVANAGNSEERAEFSRLAGRCIAVGTWARRTAR